MNTIKSMSEKLLICLALFFIMNSCNSRQQKEISTNPVIEKKIDSLLAIMTIDEKIGQLTLFSSDWDITGPTIRSSYKEDLKAGKVGAIFNAFGVEFLTELQDMAVKETRLGIPLLFGYDVIHGYRTIFPIPLAQASSWDLEAIEKSERIAAIEATAAGLHWTFAPMVDICRDPRWGRISEGAGEDPYLGSLISKARVNGFQNHDLLANNTLLACVKHYAAYGAPIAGRDYNTVDMSDRMLREVYLPPYKAAIEAGVGTVMTSFNEVDGVPASGNKYLMKDILKGEWGFQGFVVTDYTSIAEMVDHGIVANEKEAGELSLNSGIDMDMQSAIFLNFTAQSLEESRVNIKDIDDAVRRILRVKFALGLFENPYRYLDVQREKDLIMCEEHQEFARKLAAKSIVLLKNEGNILPVSKNIKSIAVIGPLADSKNDLNGCWAAQGNPDESTTLLEGLRKKFTETKIEYAKGCEVEDPGKEGFEDALKIAKNAEVVILAIGESAGMIGEAASRSNINIPGVQQELVKEVLTLGKPVIVVLTNGRPLDISWLDKNAHAILETWFLGTRAGDAIADVLSGDYNPSGKLTVSFPRNLGQVPIFYSAKSTGRPNTPDDNYTSRYLDVSNSPLYPFGFGLSYTTFSYSDIKLSTNKMNRDGKLVVSLEIKNTGKYDGEEVIQLYVQDLVGSVTRPLKELKDFKKVELKAGETKQIEFELTAEKLKFYDINMNFTVEPGEFLVFVGTNSSENKSAKFEITK